MKIHRSGWVHRMMQGLAARASESGKALKMLEVAIDNAYEGLIITDAVGVVLKVNQAYADFLGVKMGDMIGRNVIEVVENTRMHIVARTGVAEIAQIQKIRGHEMVCSRIPIFEGGRVVAVVGKVMFQDVDDLFAMIDRFKRLKSELEYYKNELSKRLGAKYSFENIVGASRELEQVKDLGRKVARSDTTVLLEGESGTGKEMFAHAIHIASNRALGPFIKVNCAAIPENLFESELFGYKEGAFTGAQKKGKKGKFALADGGTIFLDEVSELPLSMQVKLLRVLQEREIEPVGAEQPESVNVRIIAASNKDLGELVGQGLFRNDLYYRLNVVRLAIPPLRQRKNDIAVLSERILKQLEKETGIPVEGLDSETEAIFKAYSWPGNVRELRNVLEQALHMKSGNLVTRQDIPRSVVTSAEGQVAPERQRTLKFQLSHVEEELIRRALMEEKGDRLATASRLGISKSSLYAKIEQYRIC
jgi:transcriptional regulator with PAS, ATPase and Fis domain